MCHALGKILYLKVMGNALTLLYRIRGTCAFIVRSTIQPVRLPAVMQSVVQTSQLARAIVKRVVDVFT